MYRTAVTLLLLSLNHPAPAQPSFASNDRQNEPLSSTFVKTANDWQDKALFISPSNLNNTPKPYLPHSSGGSGVLFVGLCSTYELGAANVNVKYADVNTKATGLAYHIQLGFDLHYGIISDRRITSLSFELAYTHFTANGSYHDTSGVSHDNKFKVGYIGLPITYTGILGADRTVGFYYQLGICPEYQVSAKNGDHDLPGLRKLVTIPSVSIGLAIPQETGKGNLNKIRMIGPYVSTTMSNISSDNSFNFTCLTFGLRYYSTLQH